MKEVFLTTLDPMLLMLFFVAAGIVLRRSGLVDGSATKVLSKVENYLVIPLMILNTFVNYCTAESVAKSWDLLLICTGLLLLTVFAARYMTPRLFVREGYMRSVYEYSLLFNSFGFVGYALVDALFGQEQLYYYMLFVMPASIGCYVYGVPLLVPAEGEKKSRLSYLKTPSMIALFLGILLGLVGAKPYIPAFLNGAMNAGSSMFSPIAMLLTGITVGGFKVKDLFSDRKVYRLCLVRMILIPVVLEAILFAFGCSYRIMIYTLFLHAAPLGLFPVVFPAMYGKDTRPGASMAIISVLLCMITQPLLYALLSGLMNGAAL